MLDDHEDGTAPFTADRHSIDDCGDECVPAPDLVAEVAEDDGTDRAGHEADGKGQERDDGAHSGVESGEEEFVEGQGGDEAVDEIVVPLDGGADEGAGRDSTQLC